MPRTLFWIGMAAYAVLAFLAVWHYKERVIFVDAAFQLFSVIRKNSLAVQCDRYGVLFTQGAALMASRAGLSLVGVMITYSLSFVLLHWTAFVVSWRLRQPLVALTVLFFSVFMMTYTFYWIQSEYIQGAVFTLAVLAWMLYRQAPDNFSAVEMAMFPLVLITIVYFHPLLFVPYFFAIIYFYLNKAASPKMLWTGFLTVLLVMVFKSLLFKTEGYDAAAMGNLKNFIKLFPYYFTTPTFKMWAVAMLREHYLATIAFIVVSVFYLRSRQYLKLLYFWAAFGGYTLLINITYPDNAEQFYVESHWLILGIIVFLPFCWEVLPQIPHKYSVPAISILLVIRLIHIHLAHQPFAVRLDWQRDLMRQMDERGVSKIIVRREDIPMDTIGLEWGAPYEFLYLSTLESDKIHLVLVDSDTAKYQWAMGGGDIFLAPWENYKFHESEFPMRYFPVQDTSRYVVWKKE